MNIPPCGMNLIIKFLQKVSNEMESSFLVNLWIEKCRNNLDVDEHVDNQPQISNNDQLVARDSQIDRIIDEIKSMTVNTPRLNMELFEYDENLTGYALQTNDDDNDWEERVLTGNNLGEALDDSDIDYSVEEEEKLVSLEEFKLYMMGVSDYCNADLELFEPFEQFKKAVSTIQQSRLKQRSITDYFQQ